MIASRHTDLFQVKPLASNKENKTLFQRVMIKRIIMKQNSSWWGEDSLEKETECEKCV